jgi:5-oxoprolinase (ATP-hydrolysing)
MPPFSKSLAEEGVLIRAFRLVEQGTSHERDLRAMLTSGPYPSRSVEDNIADLNAQVAANQTGGRLLVELVQDQGVDTVLGYMDHVRRAAEIKIRRALGKIAPGVYRFADQLDDGSAIVAAITISHDAEGGSAVVDFAGTGPVSPGNLNANPAIVRSAVLYCFRCLLAEDIPLNDGVLAPVEIRVPEGCLLRPPGREDPAECAAVVGGNVETSQRIVDVVLGALGLAAASQGTMNNFLFGRATTQHLKGFGYYETIAGGAGAGPEFAGASAVHTHMTNTRITDPEVLEDRYPVRLRQFSIRRGSGGEGRFRGGDGAVREIEFLEPLIVSLLTNRRSTRPFGLAGGGPGAAGRNLLVRSGAAAVEELPPAVQVEVNRGDVLRLETPGGGGFGALA